MQQPQGLPHPITVYDDMPPYTGPTTPPGFGPMMPEASSAARSEAARRYETRNHPPVMVKVKVETPVEIPMATPDSVKSAAARVLRVPQKQVLPPPPTPPTTLALASEVGPVAKWGGTSALPPPPQVPSDFQLEEIAPMGEQWQQLVPMEIVAAERVVQSSEMSVAESMPWRKTLRLQCEVVMTGMIFTVVVRDASRMTVADLIVDIRRRAQREEIRSLHLWTGNDRAFLWPADVVATVIREDELVLACDSDPGSPQVQENVPAAVPETLATAVQERPWSREHDDRGRQSDRDRRSRTRSARRSPTRSAPRSRGGDDRRDQRRDRRGDERRGDERRDRDRRGDDRRDQRDDQGRGRESGRGGGDRSSGSRALKLTEANVVAVAAADEDTVNRRREVRRDDAAAQSKFATTKSRPTPKLVPKRSAPRTPSKGGERRRRDRRSKTKSQSPSRQPPRTPSSETRSRWSRRERRGADDRR